MTRANRRTVFGAMLLCACAVARAGEAPGAAPPPAATPTPGDLTPGIDYILRAGLAYSDNLFRAPAGSETAIGSAAAGVEMHGMRDTGRLTYDMAVDLMYFNYFEDYDAEVFGRALLDGTYAFVPDTFYWNAMLGFDQYRDDLARPVAPGNLDNQLSFSTGPEARMRFGSVGEAQAEAHYQFVKYSSSELDSDTIGGRLLLGRRTNPRSYLALGASADSVGYDDEVFSQLFDYDRREVFGRAELTGPRTGVSVEAGYSDVSGPAVDDNGPLFRGHLWRRLTPTLRGDFSYIREYPTSAGTSYITDPTVPGGGTIDNTILTAAPRISQNFDAGLVYQRPRTRAHLGYTWHKDTSLAETFGKRDYSEIRFRAERRFTPKATGTFFASYSKEDFTSFPEEFNDTAIGGILTIIFGRSLGLDLNVEYRNRDANNFDDTSKELAWGLYLRYSGAFGRRMTLEEDIGLD